mmetsp:Transcript_2621/g.2913  ORF Transcript_2621/g.2913 Transcript_2621/m.2913 type:complete len:603 (-) Transcript_2621:439-2247(-)|eukprot:CAMPEP_0197859800 /NCGR_PEP_ID=MMETSP1438-20131217/34691_1 /TAXON_ID=1461541 /ORGANISM="Pterosperma sp., Strain CCMP1384" /LENGTH=602 /DNA_ID=CAMNT_0043476445 /DNA_START=94 /DNA_END=1902 /DNA_ORIENTATION=+
MVAETQENGQAHLANGSVEAAHTNGNEDLKGASRSKKRREKKKAAKAQAKLEPAKEEVEEKPDISTPAEPNIEVEYVAAPVDAALGVFFGDEQDNPIYEEFKNIFEKFERGPQTEEDEEASADAPKEEKKKEVKKEKEEDDSEGSDEDNEDEDGDEMSRKKKKLARRITIADLKTKCVKPEVVEVWDCTAGDPTLLVSLKACRNTVPVPRHWCQKRKFLQGKRGIEKPPWQLPDFIEATGISEQRQAYQEKETQKTLKNKSREKLQPKVGKMNIDYRVLHDAFFKYQSKPKMTRAGDMYYEGKEFEMSHNDLKPGHLSAELKAALGMSDGAPPPWLLHMQRYGPPPSYSGLKIPGLNSPIPEGAKFGDGPMDWGRPPVDEMGNPLYGNVFGLNDELGNPYEEAVDKKLRWGELEEADEESDEESEEEEDEEEDDETMSVGTADDEAIAAGIASISSMPSGLETPDTMDLRKGKATDNRELYQVLEMQQASVGGSLMGSSHTYVMPGAEGAAAAAAAAPKKGADLLKSQKAGDVHVTLRPEELEGLDDAAIQAKYEAVQAAQQAEMAKGLDFSDMVAETANKQKRKAQAKANEPKKKHKDFKF